MAATGGILAALRLGDTAATTVTITPAEKAITALLVASTMPPAGMSNPKAASRALSPAASGMPATSPIAEATSPMPSASSSTAPSTWRRLAPIARSSAFSRVRWATVMKNVLKMMNPPTNRATRANTSMKVLKNDRPSRMASWFSSVTVAPVTASTPPGRTASRRSTSSCCDTPSSPAIEMLSNLPGLAHVALRRLGGEHRERGATRGIGAADAGDAGDGHVERRPLHEHGRPVADGVAGVVGDALVQDDVVARLGARCPRRGSRC